MPRFSPTVEVLDARTLPSAVIVGSDGPPPGPASQAAEAVQLAAPPGEAAAGGLVGIAGGAASDDAQFTNTGKVTFQDSNFTSRVNKHSPLFT